MTVSFFYCGLHAELIMSKTSTNPGRMFWSCQRYANSNGCEFLRWADIDDHTYQAHLIYQEQCYMNKPSTNIDHGRHGRQGSNEGMKDRGDRACILILVLL